jgi:hypothetical protein
MNVNQKPQSITLDISRYERASLIHPQQLEVLQCMIERRTAVSPKNWAYKMVGPLLQPVRDLLQMFGYTQTTQAYYLWQMILGLITLRKPFWVWTAAEWKSIPGNTHRTIRRPDSRPVIAAIAYHLTGKNLIEAFWQPTERIDYYLLASRFFGWNVLDRSANVLGNHLVAMGYSTQKSARVGRYSAICIGAILLGKPDVTTWTPADLEFLNDNERFLAGHCTIYAISRALCDLGYHTQSFGPRRAMGWHRNSDPHAGVAPQWAHWVDRFIRTAPIEIATKKGYFGELIQVGRWLNDIHPDIVHPKQWTRNLAAEYIGELMNFTVGRYALPNNPTIDKKRMQKLAPQAILSRLTALRSAYKYSVEWGWFRARFDPASSLRIPSSLSAQLKSAPRDVDDDIWAKLVAAAISFRPEDFPPLIQYPMPFVRAVAIVWTFAALRQDEICRLSVDCIKWSSTTIDLIDNEQRSLPTCQLMVPVNKTSPAFSKPVDAIVGEAIEAWLKVRPPAQPPLRDRKTGALTAYLFQYRGRKLGPSFLNRTVIPWLCEIAGVPLSDAKGKITTHRARSTIATQLANADEPMTLFELKEWLGHGQVQSTVHYLHMRPERLRQSFEKADYFRQNIGRMRVLLDISAIENGQAATGTTYKYYDLGHGYCGDRFFSRCPHRMACAKCSYYVPKESSLAHHLEAQNHNQRLLSEVPLRPIEIAAAKGDEAARQALIQRLENVPTPDGRTPKEISHEHSG